MNLVGPLVDITRLYPLYILPITIEVVSCAVIVFDARDGICIDELDLIDDEILESERLWLSVSAKSDRILCLPLS